MNKVHSRKPTNLSLDVALLSEARELEVNLSRAAEEGIRQEVLRTRSRAWRLENLGALESSSKFVEQNGLPLDQRRLF